MGSWTGCALFGSVWQQYDSSNAGGVLLVRSQEKEGVAGGWQGSF
jgi:hypothetical protein